MEGERVLDYSRVPVTRFIRLWVLVYNRVTIFNVTCTRDYKNRNHTSYNAYPQTYILLIHYFFIIIFCSFFLKHTLVILVNRSSPSFFFRYTTSSPLSGYLICTVASIFIVSMARLINCFKTYSDVPTMHRCFFVCW